MCRVSFESQCKIPVTVENIYTKLGRLAQINVNDVKRSEWTAFDENGKPMQRSKKLWSHNFPAKLREYSFARRATIIQREVKTKYVSRPHWLCGAANLCAPPS
jgi:hypothetical protein